MSLRRRNGVWWVDIRTSSGERVRRSTGAPEKALAQEFHDRLKAELWRIAKLGERPQRSWNEAVVRWLKEQAHKATIETDRMHFRWLDRHLGGKPLQAITRSLIDRITDAKLAKARKAIAVPLNAEAVVLIRKRLGKHPTHVFSFRAAYLGELARAARNALICLAGVGRVGKPGNGAALCALRG